MLDSIFEPGVTGVSPFAIMLSLYLAYYVHNDARWIIFFPLYWFKNMRGRES